VSRFSSIFTIAGYFAGLHCLLPSAGLAQANSTPPALWIPPSQAEWTTDGKTERSDVINIYLHGTEADVEAAALDTGWVKAAKGNPADDLLYAVTGLWDAALKEVDPSHRGRQQKPFKLDRLMPASTETYHDDPQDPRGEKQDFVFQRGDDHPFGRHHFRVYSTGKVDENGAPVWAVSATEDIGFDFDIKKPQQFFFNHTVDHDADDERDFVYLSLLADNLVVSKTNISVDVGPANRENGVTSKSGIVFNIVLANAPDEKPTDKDGKDNSER